MSLSIQLQHYNTWLLMQALSLFRDGSCLKCAHTAVKLTSRSYVCYVGELKEGRVEKRDPNNTQLQCACVHVCMLRKRRSICLNGTVHELTRSVGTAAAALSDIRGL